MQKETLRIPLIEFTERNAATIQQIVTLDESYCLAVKANNLIPTTNSTPDAYSLKPFNKNSATDQNLPGAATASPDDYVFAARVPLEVLASFFDAPH